MSHRAPVRRAVRLSAASLPSSSFRCLRAGPGLRASVFLRAAPAGAGAIDGDVDAVLHFASPASPIDYLE